ncbi:MAG: peptidylprolyl isomerase [Burkholderiaceae bacterium]
MIKRAHRSRLLVSLSIALAAGGSIVAASPAVAQNIAIVNGKPIPQKRVDEFVDLLKAQGRPDSPELRAAIKEELIARELFTQEADRQGLQKTPEFQRQLDRARQEILIRSLIQDYLKQHPVTDAAIQAEYDKLKTQTSGEKEYRARHILVDSEDQAKQIIAELGKGAKFEELAKQSKDTGSAANGGDLDWNGPSTFVKEFSEAMVKLNKGQYTSEPVKSQFGYHVIRLDDVRDVPPPPLEQVRPQIAQELERRQVQQLQKTLRERAKIE